MKKEKIKQNIKIYKILYVLVFFLFVAFILRLSYLCLVDYKVGDKTISAFINNRNMEEEVIYPTRGDILDKNGNILAQSVSSYTVIAYLSEERSKDSDTLRHVVDIKKTAEALSPLINMSVEDITNLLSKDAYQVELGPGGRNLSQLQMEKIQSLNLPGIDFIKNTKRYYPNGDFASYMLGYTVTKEEDGNDVITGELGIEEYYNETLTGKPGYVTYEKDRNGYKIANGREYIKPADDGDDIYLTIDNNIELFIENAVKKASADSEAEWALMIVADAKTGAILGYSSTPSFDPNIRNMTSYIDPIIGYAYEPGSTMKIFSYMCAIESGNYKGDETFMSGSKTYESEKTGEKVTVNDWNKKGWGEITYDQGFALSSNIAVAYMVETAIGKSELKKCYQNYGFGKKTGFTMKREETGSIDFNYQVEVATAGYGQGIKTTPIQHIQTLTAIANDGMMLKPYIVSKIVDSNTNAITYTGKKKEIRNIASKETINKMKELMRSVVQPNSEVATGYAYYMDGYDIIGKTGTAQIFDYKTGNYMPGESDYIYSFSGLYPGDNPEIIVYTAIKRPKDTTNYLAPIVKEVITNISKYLNIKETKTINTTYKIDSYINKNINTVKSTLKDSSVNLFVLGDGEKVVNQFPEKNSVLTKGDNLILLTNHYDNKMPNLLNLSYKEANIILKYLNLNYELEGTGYVVSQSIEPGTVITENDAIKLVLEKKYQEVKDEEVKEPNK